MKRNLLNKYLLLLFLIQIVLSTKLFAQKETYNWYFGGGAGITFMPDGEEAKFSPNGKIDIHYGIREGSAALSDRNGNLLFYSDGFSIWNKNHRILKTSGLKGHYSSARSAIIIPKPGSNQYYYIFTIDAFENYVNKTGNGLQYSMIDIFADNGHGDIIDSIYNIKLLENASEKMITINHFNKTDVWLVTYNFADNNYYTYLITNEGISAPKKTLRPFPTVYEHRLYGAFNLEYDFIHNKIISCDDDINSFVIYDFDPATGTISTNNPTILPAYPSGIDTNETFKYNPYSAAISEDGSKFYGTCYGKYLLQWDLSAGDNDSIVKSRTTISDATTGNADNTLFGAIRKGPDNRMYIARHKATHLAVINFPNEFVEKCDFVSDGIYLEGTLSGYGLPIMMNYDIIPCEFVGFAGGDKNICYGGEVILGGNYDTTNFTFLWTPSEGLDDINILNPTCKIMQSTQYILMVRDNTLGCFDYDTIFVSVIPPPNVISAEDVTVCKNSPVVIGNNANNPDFVYEWIPTDFLEIPNGRVTLCYPDRDMVYILSILDTTTGCYNYDTISVFVRDLDNFELLGSMFICEGKNATIGVKDDFVSYYWSTGENTKSIIINEAGVYEIVITDSNGCSGSQTFEITYLESDNFEIIAPAIICVGIETILKTNISFNKYLWSTGDTTSTISIYSAGTYWVNVENENGCSATDTVNIDEIIINYSFPSEIIFPIICNDTHTISSVFENNGHNDIIISNISLYNSNSDFDINETFVYPTIIEPNNKITITTNFDGTIAAGYYTDTLIITLLSPCAATILVPILAEVGGSDAISISTIPTIKTQPGEKIIIPATINIDAIETMAFDSYVIKCAYRRDMIQIYNTNVGEIIGRTQNGLIETIQIKISLIVPEIKLELYANTSLGRDTISDIIFFDFESTMPCFKIDSIFVPFELVGCNLGTRIFNFFNPTELIVNTEDNHYNCEILSEEEGHFNLSIYNLIGNKILEKKWRKENKILEKKNILLNNSDLSSGSYFILLQTPNEFIRKKVLKIN